MPHDTLHTLRSMLYLLEHTAYPISEESIIRDLCGQMRNALSKLSDLEKQNDICNMVVATPGSTTLT